MIVKALLTVILPKLIMEAYDFVSSYCLEVVEEAEADKSKPKQVDRTRFTQENYDFATTEFKYWVSYGKVRSGEEISTHIELTKYLNEVFGTNKSVSTMRRLYTGQVSREKLPSKIPN